MFNQLSCTQPQFQPIAWTAQNVPQLHVLQQQLPQGLHQFIAPLTSAVLNLATHDFNRHAGRMFLFNQLYFNNFNNNELIGTVLNAINILSIFINTGQANNTNISQYIGGAAEIAVELQVAANILNQQNTMLHQALGQVGIAGAQQVFQKHAALIQQINQVKAQQTNMPGSINFQPQSNFSGGLGVNNNFRQFDASNAYSRTGEGFVADSIGSDDELTKILVSGVPKPNEKYSSFDANFTNVAAPNNKWVSNPNQLHPPAYNSLTHKAELRPYKTEQVYYLLERPMDVKQHITGQSLTAASVIIDPTSFQKKIDKLEYVANNKVDPKDNIPNWMKGNQVIDGPDLNYIVNLTCIQAALANHGVLPDGCAYSLEGYVVEPIVSATDMTELMEFIYRADDFIEIAEHLKYLLTCSTSGTISPAFIDILNQRLTQCVNSVFTDCLSISLKELMITNFIEDIHQVKNHLNNVYGVRVLNAFNQSQHSAIRRMFTSDYFITDESREEIKNQYIMVCSHEDKELTNININFFMQNVIVTVVNLHSKEINLELTEPDVANLVGSETGPIGRFMDHVLSHIIEKDNINNKLLDYRVVFVTQDRKLFEVFLSPYERAFTVKQITE